MIADQLDTLEVIIPAHILAAKRKIKDTARLHHSFNLLDAMADAAKGSVFQSTVAVFVLAAERLLEAAHQNPEALAAARPAFAVALEDLWAVFEKSD